MSRHHIQPPAVYMPPPPKPKETKRKRGVGYTRAAKAADEAGEAEQTAQATPARAVPQHQLPIEGAERKIPSPNSKLSDDTLKAMLEMQERDGAQRFGTVSPSEE